MRKTKMKWRLLATGILGTLLTVMGVQASEVPQGAQTLLLEALDINKLVQPTDRPSAVGARANLNIFDCRFLNGVRTRTESRLYVQLDGKTVEFSGEVEGLF